MKKSAANGYLITPGFPLHGSITVQGSKNALLPILAAALLRPGNITLRRVPQITDGMHLLAMAEHLGGVVSQSTHQLILNTDRLRAEELPPHLLKSTRGGVLLLGAMMARCRRFSFTLPGGCHLGKRPIDYHINGLAKMGVEFKQQNGGWTASCRQLNGSSLTLPYPSVGATQNLLLAACGANGKTVLSGAAIEPEVLETVSFLQTRGYEITRTENRQFTVLGNPALSEIPLDSSYTLPADRIAAVTYLAAAAVTGGEITLHGICESELGVSAELFRRSGCRLWEEHGLHLQAPERLHGIGAITTGVYPAFATDMQPIFSAMVSKADSPSVFTETVFENRFSHIAQLCQMGAKIRLRQKSARIEVNDHLGGRELLAPDLRGGAALVIAALQAEGESRISGIEFIERGYDDMPGVLSTLGGNISLL